MSAFIGSDASVTINSVDLSDHVRSVTFSESIPAKRKTAMGATGEQALAGLPTRTLTIEWLQDHAASEVDATLEPLVGAAEFAYLVKPTSSAVGVGNPSRAGNCILTEYQPISQDVGEVANASTTFYINTYTYATA